MFLSIITNILNLFYIEKFLKQLIILAAIAKFHFCFKAALKRIVQIFLQALSQKTP